MGNRALRPGGPRGRVPVRDAQCLPDDLLRLVFLVSKMLEWTKEIRMGNTFTSDEFFQHYYFLTSIHCIHLLIGFVVLGVVVYQL